MAFLKKLFRKRGGSRDSPREAASPAPEIPDSFLLHFASSAGQHAGFGAAETAHNGLPVDCRCIAYDPVQRLVAVGSKTGIVKVYGAEGIEMTLAPVEVGDSNNEDVAFLVFIPSQHRLLAVQANSAVNIWDMRFQRQCGYLHNQWTSCRVTCAFYAPQSHYHYLYLSTDDGVVHVLDTQGCALTAYRIRAVEDLGLSDEIPETGEPAEVVALVPNPVDATRLLIAFAHAGVALWDVPKRKVVHWFKYERPTLCDAHDPDSDEPFAIRCVTWHNSGTQILAGCESGYFVHWHNETKGCEKGVVHWVDGTASAATLCSPISHIEWALTPNVDTDVGCIVVAGGSKMHDDPLHADPHGIGILWLDAHSVASVAKKGGLTWSAEHARSIILPTANGGAVADFNLAYPQGSGPGYGPGFPSAAVVLTGGDGTAVRVWLHPLPSVKGAWPPIAAARPMPLPPPMPMPPLLHCRSLSASAPSTTPPITCIALLPAVPSDELGAAFNDVLRAKNRWKTLPMPKMYPEWKWPVDGGAMENSPPFFDVAGNLLNAAEVKRTIEEAGRDDERENEGKLAPQVQTIITGHADGTVCFWDVSAPLQTRACASAPLRLVHELRIFLTSCLEGDAPDPPSISCAHCDPDSGLLALGFPSGEIIVFRLSGTMGFEEVWRTSVHAPNEIKKIVLAPEANRMVSIDVNGCVQMSHLPFDIAEEEEEEEEEETTSKGGGTEERGDVAGGEDEGPPPTPPRQKEEEEEGGPPTPPRRFENAALCASSASSISLCALPASTWTGRSPSPLASRSASPRSPSPRVPATPGSPDAAGGGGKISPTVAVGGTLGTIDFYSFSNGRALGTLSASDLEVGAGGVHFIFPIACTGEPQPLLSSSMPETAVGEAAPTLVVVGIGATVALLAIELPSEASLADGNLRMLPASLAKKAFDAEIVSASIVSIGASSWGVMVLLADGVVHVLGLLDLAIAHSSPPIEVHTVGLHAAEGHTAQCASDGQLFLLMPGCELVRKQFVNLPTGASREALAAALDVLDGMDDSDDDVAGEVTTAAADASVAATATATTSAAASALRAALLFRPNVSDDAAVERCCASPAAHGRAKSKGRGLFRRGKSASTVDLNTVFSAGSAGGGAGAEDEGDRYQEEHAMLMERLRARKVGGGGSSAEGMGDDMLGALSQLKNKMSKNTELAKATAAASAKLAENSANWAAAAKEKAPKKKFTLFKKKKR